jgi:hypothetical protein
MVVVGWLAVDVEVGIDTVGARVDVSVEATTTGSAGGGGGSAWPHPIRLRKDIPKTIKSIGRICFSCLLNGKWANSESIAPSLFAIRHSHYNTAG